MKFLSFKNTKIIIIFLLIVSVYLSFSASNVLALVSNENSFSVVSTATDSDEDTELYKTCALKMTKFGEYISFSAEVNGAKANANYYGFNIGDSKAWCLEPTKSASNGAVYERGPAIGRDLILFYKAYQYYLNKIAQGDTQAEFRVQIFMWALYQYNYIGNLSDSLVGKTVTLGVYKNAIESNDSQIVSKMENMFNTAIESRNCEIYVPYLKYVGKLRNEFSCSSWRKCNSVSTEDDCTIEQISEEEGEVSILTMAEYIYLVNQIPLSVRQNMPRLYSMSISKFISDIMATSPYPETLYLWYPNNSNNQVVVGVEGCKDKPSSCSSDITDLKNKYPENTRIASNIAYMKDLEAIEKKYGFTIDRNEPEDISNPYCGTCTSTLAEFNRVRSYASSGRSYYYYDKWGVKHSSSPSGKLTRLWNKLLSYRNFDPTNVACEPDDGDGGGVEPKCDPNYENYECGFSSNIGGIAFSDQGSAGDGTSCYFSRNIGYTTDSRQKIGSVDKDLSNKYCTVKCWESFEAKFPAALSNIPAGSTFFWGLVKSNGNFGEVNVTRYCSTVDINYDLFNSEFNSNETAILKAYENYKAQELYAAKQPVEDGQCVLSSSTSTVPASVSECNANGWSCFRCNGNREHDESSDTWCRRATKYVYGTNYKKDKSTYGTYGESTYDSICASSDASGKAAAQRALNSLHLSTRKATLNNLIKARKDLLFTIRSCESSSYINNNNDGHGNSDGTIYHFDTKVTLKYTDPLGTNRNITNPLALLQNRKNVSFNDNGQINAATPILSVGCTHTPGISGIGEYDGCNSSIVNINRYNEYHWSFLGTYYYDYPKADYFWYSLKESAYVKNEKSYTTGSIAPYVIGYGIPTGFALKTGFYDISVDVEGFGNHYKQWDENGRVISGVNYHFEPLVKEKLSTSVYNYACPYHVINKLYGSECEWDCDFSTKTCTLRAGSPDYCEGGVRGIDLVYRVIELNKDEKVVFPGLIGTGRKQGENWATFIQTKRNWFTNIMNHGLIYDDEPIYSIDLTPGLIQEIRQSNIAYRVARKDPYTSFTDESNAKKVYCEGETVNQTCASEWLSNLIGRGLLTGQYCTSSNTNERLQSIKTLKNQYDGAVR